VLYTGSVVVVPLGPVDRSDREAVLAAAAALDAQVAARVFAEGDTGLPELSSWRQILSLISLPWFWRCRSTSPATSVAHHEYDLREVGPACPARSHADLRANRRDAAERRAAAAEGLEQRCYPSVGEVDQRMTGSGTARLLFEARLPMARERERFPLSQVKLGSSGSF
jgi:hypothetical protein